MNKQDRILGYAGLAVVGIGIAYYAGKMIYYASALIRKSFIGFLSLYIENKVNKSWIIFEKKEENL